MRSISGFGSRILAFVFTVCFFTISVASATDVSFSYDANGNMINGDGLSYVYDDANHLTEVRLASNNSLVAQYLYDDAGNRVKKVSGGVTKYYIGDLVETRVQGAQRKDTTYYFANTERVARKDADGSKYYYHGDHLGSTSIVTNASGAVVESVAYLPYGETQSKTGSGSTYLYTDQELDPESGLYYYDARYYSPEMMRFVEPDSIIQDVYNPQNLNEYSYVINNPVNLHDPSGNVYIPGISELSEFADSLTEQYLPSLAAHNENMRYMVQNNPDELWNAGNFEIAGVNVKPGAIAQKMYENPVGFFTTIAEGAVDAATLGGGGSVKTAITTGFKVGVTKETLHQIGEGGDLNYEKIGTAGFKQSALSGSLYIGAEKVVNALPMTEQWSNGATRVIIRDEAGKFVTHTSADKVANLWANQAEMVFFNEPYSSVVQNALPRLQ